MRNKKQKIEDATAAECEQFKIEKDEANSRNRKCTPGKLNLIVAAVEEEYQLQAGT